MERVKDYLRVEFSATALRKIVETLKDIVKDPAKTSIDRLRIQKKGESCSKPANTLFIQNPGGSPVFKNQCRRAGIRKATILLTNTRK